MYFMSTKYYTDLVLNFSKIRYFERFQRNANGYFQLKNLTLQLKIKKQIIIKSFTVVYSVVQ